MTKVVILQSNYIPWRGYFDLIRQADHFVFYDTVQFTKRDWRNRNIVITSTGPVWLTVPVSTSGKFDQAINSVRISGEHWADKHLKTLQLALGRAPFFRVQLKNNLEDWYSAIAGMDKISDVNRYLIERVMQKLDVNTQLHDAADLPQMGDKTGRLLSICQSLGATCYLSGPSAQSYLDVEQFHSAGITVDWMAYPEYPPYPQMDGKYSAGVSIIDCLAHLPANMVF